MTLKNKETIEFTVLAEKELMERCLVEINGLTGANFELIDFELFEVPLCTLQASKWELKYIFKLGTIYQRFSSLEPDEWKIPNT